MISFPRCIAINLNPAVFASCRQLNDVILMIIREWCIFSRFNALQRYCTRPPREPIRMTDVISGGLEEDALLLFGKEEMGPRLLGHRGIRSKAETFNSAHLRMPFSLFSLRRLRSNQLPGDFPETFNWRFYSSLTWSKHVETKNKGRGEQPCSCLLAFLPGLLRLGSSIFSTLFFKCLK